MRTSLLNPRRTLANRGETISVVVRAADPMAGLGAAHILGADARLIVLPESDAEHAQVIVVIDEFVGDNVFGFLQDVRAASQRDTPPRSVIVTDNFRVDSLMMAIQCGMAAVLPRSSTQDEELVRTVFAVSQGAACLPFWLQGTLLTQLDRMRRDILEPNGLTLSGLSKRERDVIRLLADGHSTEEIAAMLSYSERTVKNILHGLMRRYGLANRAHAVAFAWRAGVL
ncbi:helix-turn-helix transcriptional regulator [Kibdelosporangium phytohabitans]|uniref:LuxR family transcriptional regulator n=1 Tax=Kibdelosporangium phytohabitans TaxID=860235 RepID=A0A0N7F3E9_9PSEU|nr:LuxR C-terminal-related transcriptional regulator [Kibdelosporangium phytohabitans]ALG08439.1 LuxR family transcriptional regulator [Kibdelosporangium phytohabitans]MBE1470509.1 DNA-binding NarL/FixJ family response regulator [Kibdelosporangium phytohabitans]